jgi:hypothetical protein
VPAQREKTSMLKDKKINTITRLKNNKKTELRRKEVMAAYFNFPISKAKRLASRFFTSLYSCMK